MYFPVAGIEVNPLLPPVVAFGISFLTSMGGVSGAFLLLPFQVSVLGFTSPAVSSTNQLFNIVAIPSGVWRYLKEGRMVWPLAWIVIIGTLPGVFIGAVVRIRYLPDPTSFKAFAGLVLLYIGARLVYDMFRKRPGADKQAAEARFQELVMAHRAKAEAQGRDLPRVRVEEFSLKRIVYEFYGERYEVPVTKISIISFVVGIVGGTYGIGGGAIMAPIYVAVFHLPVHTVAGAALMGTCVTSVGGVVFYQCLAPFYPGMRVAPDWVLGLLFGIGGMAGMYCGARFQKFVPARVIKWILAA
ncbi:MAG: TSUP family transporter, partial [Desulfovibrionaceae bacterium]|nr:TSUP family transporter [Desulfovibrionaceae bacterium]